MAYEAPLAPEDGALLDRLAARVVALRLEVPAVLTLESAKPVSLLASQALVFFEPLAQALFGAADLRRWARLLERRENLETLERLIETQADAARAARRAAAAPGSRGR